MKLRPMTDLHEHQPTRSPTDTLASEPSHGSNCSSRAETDWAQIVRSRRASMTLALWGQSSPNLGRHRSLDDVVVAMRGLDRSRSNPYWDELLAIARTGDQLARRVMLQVVVPGLEAETTRWHHVFTGTGPTHSRSELQQVVYASAVQAIHHLESTRRVSWPVLDVLRATRRLVRRQVRSDERWAAATISVEDPDCPDLPASTAEVDPFDGLDQVLRELVEAGRVSPENASLVWQTRSGRQTFEDLAVVSGVSADSLRRRRHRTEQALLGAFAHAA